jgi:uncharacterized protein involved in exopolysaccharide biosynthesis
MDETGSDILGGQLYLPTVGTQAAVLSDIITSRSAALFVIQKHKQSLWDREPEDEDIEDFMEQIRTEVTQSGQLAVGFAWDDRAVAQAVLEDLVRYARDRSKELSREFAEDAVKFLEKEVERQRNTVLAQAEAVKQAVGRSPIAATAVARDKFVESLITSTTQLNALMAEARAADAALGQKMQAILRARAAGEKGEPLTAALADLQKSILDQKAKMEAARETVAPDSPEMRSIRAELDASIRVYIEELDRLAQAAQSGGTTLTLQDAASRASKFASVQAAQSALARLRQEAMQVANLAIEQQTLLNDLERAESALTSLYADLTQARLAREKVYLPFVVLDPPYAPTKPSFPLPGVFASAGLLLGLLVGIWIYTKSLQPAASQQESAGGTNDA